MNWYTFKVEQAVVHYVPTGRDERGVEPLLLDSTIDLDPALQGYSATRPLTGWRRRGWGSSPTPTKPRRCPDPHLA